MSDHKFDLGKALASENINWEYHAREQKDKADKLKAENQRLRGLLERTLGAIEYYGRSHTDFPNLTQDIKKELSDE
jgi:hypothetical protein